jgi:internalin A
MTQKEITAYRNARYNKILNLQGLDLENFVDSGLANSETQTLNLSSNRLKGVEIAKFFSKFKNLKELDISNNLIGNDDLKIILDEIPNVSSLNISGNLLGDKAIKLIAAKLPNLEILKFDKSYLSDKGILSIGNFQLLVELSICRNSISSRNIKSLTNLTSLKYLKICDNFITDDGIGTIAESPMKLIELNISNNNLSDNSAIALASFQRQIENLDISNNKIGFNGLRQIIASLSKLKVVKTDGNDLIKKEVPAEILSDIISIRGFFESNDFVQNPSIKVVLLGNTKAGKSSFANLFTNANEEIVSSTHGIKIWRYNIKSENIEANINIFDFGGQDYYHSTHNLFLNTKALYCLLWHPNFSNEKTDIDQLFPIQYWLGNINYFSPDDIDKQLEKNVWIIQNKGDILPQKEIIDSQLLNFYNVDPEGIFLLSINEAKNNIKWQREWIYFESKLRDKLIEIAGNTKVSIYTIKIKDEIIQPLKSQFIVLFSDIYEKAHELFAVSETAVYSSLDYLSKNGDVIWYKNNEQLKQFIFPDPVIFSEYIYKILALDVKNTKSGHFYYNDVEKITSSILVKSRISLAVILLQVLSEHELIFPSTDGNTYTAPQYLPENKNAVRFQKLLTLSLVIYYDHYMPFGLISTFITRFVNNSENPELWKYGAIYEKSIFNIMVRMDTNKRKVYIHIEQKQEVYNHTSSRLKYDYLKDYFDFFTKKNSQNRLNNLYISTNDQDFFSLDDLPQLISDKRDKTKTLNSDYRKIPAIFYSLLGKQKIIPKKIFFSYSHKDWEYRGELDSHLAGLKRSGLIETWFDMQIQAGAEWDTKILEELSKADIVLLLLSPDFINSKYIWEKEIPIAHSQGKRIIPIFLRPCDFNIKNYFPENYASPFNPAEIQGIPFSSKGILWITGGAPHERDEKYLNVVTELRKIIESYDGD